MTLLYVSLGGAFGSALRWWAAGLVNGRLGSPYGTLFVNVTGSLVMGVAVVLLVEQARDPRLAALLMTGVLGGYTTFSAFSLDTILLVEGGRLAAALAYVAGSVLLSLAGLALGITLARWLA